MSGERRALLIGTAAYPADPALPDLRCPVNDVDGMAEVLQSPELGGFETVELLRDATSNEAKRALVAFCRDAKRNDTVLFYYSGHGKLDGSFALHLCTTDSEIDLLEATALPISFVRDQFKKCRAENRVMLLDCCFSGAAAGVSARSALDDTLKLSVEGTGTYLMTASDSIETAQEKEGDDYGVFTKHVIEGLRTGAADVIGRGFVTMDDLYEYVAKEIRADSPQRPNREFSGHGDILIARSGKDSRKDRANDARQLLFKHVAEGTLDASVASAAFAALSKPVTQQTPAEKSIEVATLAFLDGKSTLGEFSSAYWRAQRQEPAPPPEPEPPKPDPRPKPPQPEPPKPEPPQPAPTPAPAATGFAAKIDSSLGTPGMANYGTPIGLIVLAVILFASSVETAVDLGDLITGPMIALLGIGANIWRYRPLLKLGGWVVNGLALLGAFNMFVAVLSL